MINVFVPGKASPQGSKKHVGHGILVESCKEVGPWRERVALAVAAQGEALIQKPEPVSVILHFILPRPTSTSKKNTPPATKRPDLDKLVRAILDALTHILYEDDSQVNFVTATKRLAELGETPGVQIIL